MSFVDRAVELAVVHKILRYHRFLLYEWAAVSISKMIKIGHNVSTSLTPQNITHCQQIFNFLLTTHTITCAEISQQSSSLLTITCR